MSDWNRKLRLQLKEHFGELDRVPQALSSFLKVISQTYDEYEEGKSRANRMLSVKSQIDKVIVRVQQEKDLYSEVCRIVVEVGRFKTAYIALAGPENEEFEVKAHSGAIESLTYLARLHSVLPALVQRREYYICNSIATDKLLTSYPALTAEYGYGSCIILPLRRSGAVVGTFNLYATQPGFINDAEVALLKQAAEDMSFALEVLELNRQRTLAEQKLRTSEWRLRQAQAIAHLGSWTLDLATGIAMWSKEALRIYGIDTSQSQQSYESWIAHIHPDDLPYVLDITIKSRQTLSRSSFFHRIIRSDGTVRHLYSQADFELNEDGAPIGLYGVLHDVTEMKLTEQALRKSQVNMQAIFDNTSEGFILTDPDCRIKAFNNKAKEIILANTGRVISTGDDLRIFSHPLRRSAYNDVLEEVMAGKTLRYQYPFNRKGGEVKWFHFSVSPVYSGDTVTGIVVTTTDITKRRLAELKLIESEKRYSDIFRLSPISMWVYDRATLRFLNVNQAAITHYGYTLPEFLEMTIKDIRPPEDIPLLEQTIVKNRAKKSPVLHQSFRHKKKNGEIIHVEIQSSNITYQGHKAKLIVAQDVTERLLYVKAIEEQNAKLKEISWMQSHIVRAPLVRIMALIPIISNDEDPVSDKKTALVYLQKSADELDAVIKSITRATEVVNIKKQQS